MKLTTSLKNRIIDRILDATFAERNATLEKETAFLADQIYGDFYGTYLSDMDRLPETFFVQQSQLHVKFAGDRYHEALQMSGTRRISCQHQYGGFEFPVDHPFTAKFRMIQAKDMVLSKDVDSLRATLRAVVIPCNTDKQLIQVWPDAEQYIPRDERPKENLPTVDVADVNAMINSMKEVK